MKEPILEPLLRWLRLRKVISQIPPKAILLDIGCGKKAAFLKAISQRISYGYGVDFKVENIELGNIKVKQFVIKNSLPFDDSSFDIVTMLAVLEHIEKEQDILREVHRVLKPGGKLILTVPSVWSQPILEFLSYKLKIVSEAEIRDHKRYYNREKLEKVLIKTTEFQEFNHQYFQCWMNNFCTVVKGSK